MKLILIIVFAAVFIDDALMAGEPDCVALANENPLKINRYYHRHESDCNKYYQCSRYGLIEMHCPESLNFDSKLFICGRPHEVTSFRFQATTCRNLNCLHEDELVTIEHQKCKVQHYEFDNHFCAIIVSIFAQQAPDCVSLARSIPEDISKYYYHHENDCNKYYQCAEYGLVLKSCPEDLHFDRNEYVCGWPHEVNC